MGFMGGHPVFPFGRLKFAGYRVAKGRCYFFSLEKFAWVRGGGGDGAKRASSSAPHTEEDEEKEDESHSEGSGTCRPGRQPASRNSRCASGWSTLL